MGVDLESRGATHNSVPPLGDHYRNGIRTEDTLERVSTDHSGQEIEAASHQENVEHRHSHKNN